MRRASYRDLRNIRPLVPVTLLLFCSILLVGCGGNPRQNITGNVTYDGKPVELGTIVFTQAGVVGGHASIRNGAFDTGASTSLGVLPGMNEVVIKGYHPAQGDGAPRKPLFPPYETQIEVLPTTAKMDFKIPLK